MLAMETKENAPVEPCNAIKDIAKISGNNEGPNVEDSRHRGVLLSCQNQVVAQPATPTDGSSPRVASARLVQDSTQPPADNTKGAAEDRNAGFALLTDVANTRAPGRQPTPREFILQKSGPLVANEQHDEQIAEEASAEDDAQAAEATELKEDGADWQLLSVEAAHCPEGEVDAQLLQEDVLALRQARHAKISIRVGTGRDPTPRSFLTQLMRITAPPAPPAAAPPMPAPPLAARTPVPSPQVAPPTGSLTGDGAGTAPRTAAKSMRGATPMEGVPERIWRSMSKTPAAQLARLATPIEGVPERDWPVGVQTQGRLMSNPGSAAIRGQSWQPSATPLTDGSPILLRGRNAAPPVSNFFLIGSPVERDFIAARSQMPATPGADSVDDWMGGDDYGDDFAHGFGDADIPAKSEPQQTACGRGGSTTTTPRVRPMSRAASVARQDMECQTGASLGGELPTPAQPPTPAGERPGGDVTEDPAAEDQAEASAQAAGRGERKRDRKSEMNQRLKRMYHQRKSLAGAGMQEDHGRRRSTRQRHRPLDWWRNEGKVYKREHRSLPTVDHVVTHTPGTTWKFVNAERPRRRAEASE